MTSPSDNDATRVNPTLNGTILGEYLATKEKRLLWAVFFQFGGLAGFITGFIILFTRFFGQGDYATSNHLFFGQLLWFFSIGLFAITIALGLSARRQAFLQALVPCAIAICLLYFRP